ncbi:hypothetical protein RRG08_051656 [Elysia crispata]|uniref:Uncharacterized protein n=1 Tax=Elysia crispata TaxID=231223 RepID=A0AAE1DSM9_9GAST|nr:hypothetical protein RRG08_051656 [Elysia crispata]
MPFFISDTETTENFLKPCDLTEKQARLRLIWNCLKQERSVYQLTTGTECPALATEPLQLYGHRLQQVTDNDPMTLSRAGLSPESILSGHDRLSHLQVRAVQITKPGPWGPVTWVSSTHSVTSTAAILPAHHITALTTLHNEIRRGWGKNCGRIPEVRSLEEKVEEEEGHCQYLGASVPTHGASLSEAGDKTVLQKHLVPPSPKPSLVDVPFGLRT